MKKVLTLLTFCFYYSVASYAQDNGLSRKSEKKGTPANGVEAK